MLSEFPVNEEVAKLTDTRLRTSYTCVEKNKQNSAVI